MRRAAKMIIKPSRDNGRREGRKEESNLNTRLIPKLLHSRTRRCLEGTGEREGEGRRGGRGGKIKAR